MIVGASGYGAVTCAGIGVPQLRSALAEGLDFERRRLWSPGIPAAPICALPDIDLVKGLQVIPLEPQIKASIARAGHRAALNIRAALLAVAEAWANAKLHTLPVKRDRIGLVIAGSNLTQLEHARLYGGKGGAKSSWAMQFMDTNHVGVISEAFDILGEGFSVGGASASGNVALAQGKRLIESGAAEVCVVVGAMMSLSLLEYEAFQNAGAMAVPNDEAERCNRPLDVGARGFVVGEGAGCIVLETIESSSRRGHLSQAILAGTSICLHAHRFGSPSVEGEVRAIELALSSAGMRADAIDYVSAHATGTPMGDAVEVAALSGVFPEGNRPYINSTKSIIGHTLTAAGVLESICVLIQLNERWVHGTANLKKPISSQFDIPDRKIVPTRLNVALSNSFGFGGINSSVLWVGA